ncbi:MAG: glycosyltransferase [Solirubrobacteraceae bacterium]
MLQTGAWIAPDERELPARVEAFLAAGEPPVYIGFGSVRAPAGISEVMLQAARALGRRVIVSRGWAELLPVGNASDCISVDDINQQALFKRVAAVIHHAGAGTTTTAARAGVPQVAIPQLYDQHYWAGRVQNLGIGTAHPPVTPTSDSLTAALTEALEPNVATRAHALAGAIRTDGATIAAKRLLA